MIKQFMLLKAQGNEDSIDVEWEMNIKHLADAFVKTWDGLTPVAVLPSSKSQLYSVTAWPG